MNTLAGQVIARRLLEANLAEQRPFHAFLFTGPEGIGKLDTAVQFACALNGIEEMGEHCNSKEWLRIKENRNPDIRVIRGEGASLKIEQMREMIHDIQLRPYQSKWKVFIIHEAEKMSQAAANSVLKVLEEPPPQGIIIMTTAHPGQILPTIRSRCQIIPFRPMSQAAIIEELENTYGTEGELARLIAGLAEGMPAKAVAMAQNPTLVSFRTEVFDEIERLYAGTHKDRIALVRDYERNRNAEEKLRLWCTVIRDILVWRLTRDAALLYHQDKTDFYDSLKEPDVYQGVQFLNRIEAAIFKLQRNINSGLVIHSAISGFNKVFAKEEANG